MLDVDVDCEWEDLDEAFTQLEAELSLVVRGMSFELWHSILIKTPQYLGRMAASWSYSLNTPLYVDRSDQIDTGAIDSDESLRHRETGLFAGLYRGHPAAIKIANRESAGKADSFRLGDSIYMANGVDHGEGPYSVKLEEGGVALRPWNLPGAPLKRSLELITARYSDDVSSSEASSMVTRKFGE